MEAGGPTRDPLRDLALDQRLRVRDVRDGRGPPQLEIDARQHELSADVRELEKYALQLRGSGGRPPRLNW